MSRMIDLIRASAVPANLMTAASKGALSVPAEEMVEILVYLANHNKIFGEQARLTLAGWDPTSAQKIAANPKTPAEVLEYFIAPENLRPALVPVLLENPSVSEESLMALAANSSREVVESMLSSSRVDRSETILNALTSNPHLTGVEEVDVKSKLGLSESNTSQDTSLNTAKEAPSKTAVAGTLSEDEDDNDPEAKNEDDAILEEAISGYLTEHAGEIDAEADKPFQPIGGIQEGLDVEAEEPPVETPAESSTDAATETAIDAAIDVKTIAMRTAAAKAIKAGAKRGSTLQKISALDIKGRIQLAMKGTKEERTILIRDGTKVVALAVLDSPKISDAEVEGIANQKNVLETVLRAIPMKRRFAKNYNIVRNLVFNPRTPLDCSLGLMKNLQAKDLKNLCDSKGVSDTIRKSAMRMFKQKSEANKKN